MTEQSDSAIARIEARVKRKAKQRDDMAKLIRPTLQAFYNNRLSETEKRQLPELDVNAPNWETLLTGVGLFYQAERKANKSAVTSNRALLAFIWRATFEFDTDIGDKERENLIGIFALDDNATNTANVSALKKLSALQHRPMRVAKAIMLGDIPLKRDEILASFVRQVIKDGYTYTDDGVTQAVTNAYMSNWIEQYFDGIKDLTTKTAMLKFWQGKGKALSPDQEKAKKTTRDDEQASRVIDKCLKNGSGKTGIDESNLSRDAKGLAQARMDLKMAHMGYFPVNAGNPLHYYLSILIGKKEQDYHNVFEAIAELEKAKVKLKEILAHTDRKDTGNRLVTVVEQAQRVGLIADNGKVELDETPVEDLATVPAS